MALHRISDRHPNYRDLYFKGDDLKGMPVYTAYNKAVGSVYDLMVDDHGTIQQLVVDLGDRKVLVPVDRCSRSKQAGHVYINNLDGQDFSRLPSYEDGQPVDEDLLRQPRYQSGPTEGISMEYAPSEIPVEQSVAVEDSAPVEGRPVVGLSTEARAIATHQPPHQKDLPIQLYEERLVTNKQRVKTGEVKISKRTVTDTSHSRLPITREKVIIEIESVYAGETKVDFGQAEVDDDGTVRMGIYEEQAEVCQRIVPYQNVAIRKELVEDTIPIQQTTRREELDIQATAPYIEITQ